MLGAAESMVASNEMEFDRKRGNNGSYLLDEPAAALRQNHAVFPAVENGRADRSKPVETRLPIGLALLDPLPREREIPMRRLIVPGHPAGGAPRMVPLVGDGAGPDSHHIERGGNEDELFDNGILLRHEPRNPAAERVTHDGQGRTGDQRADNPPSVLNPIGQGVIGECAV